MWSSSSVIIIQCDPHPVWSSSSVVIIKCGHHLAWLIILHGQSSCVVIIQCGSHLVWSSSIVIIHCTVIIQCYLLWSSFFCGHHPVWSSSSVVIIQFGYHPNCDHHGIITQSGYPVWLSCIVALIQCGDNHLVCCYHPVCVVIM